MPKLTGYVQLSIIMLRESGVLGRGEGEGWGVLFGEASCSLTVIASKNHLKSDRQTKHSLFIYLHTL